MKGYLYVCEWLQELIAGDYPGHEPRPLVASRTRALWVPDAELLVQWSMPDGKMQVTKMAAFPPSPMVAQASLLEQRSVPYAVVKEAHRYLQRRAHYHSQEAAIQQALDRITRLSIDSEKRLQDALKNASLQD